jgi:hypothetical protein
VDLRDYEWQLTHPGGQLTWGYPWGQLVNLTAPDLGDPEIRADDSPRPRGDGQMFGVDYRGGRTVIFEIGTVARDEATARDLAEQVTVAWRADLVRSTPGAVAELGVRYAGRHRMTYGRPRRCVAIDELAPQGHIALVASFATVDDLWYGAAVHSETFGLAPPLGGGLTGALAAPLTTTGSSDRSRVITVGGKLPAWPTVTIHGPITNPVVEVIGLWRLELLTTLAYDRSVVIDTRPWSRAVLLDNGGSLAGALSRRSPRLTEAVLPPGQWEVVLSGTDESGTAQATLAWQDTYASP